MWEGGGSRSFQGLPKQVVSPLKSHSLCCSMWLQFSISKSFLSALQNKQLSLMLPFFSPPLPSSLSVSLISLSLPVIVVHLQVDGRHQKGWVGGIWEGHGLISVERDISLRACVWSDPQLGDKRWCRRKDNPGNHPGAGWQCGDVTVEQKYVGVIGQSVSWLYCSCPIV